jgi:hypothetical protein
LEKDHPMTISSTFSSYWANGFKQEDFYGNFPMQFKKNLLLWNYWANLNQTLLKWSLGGPLPKMCPTFQTSDQDGATAELNCLAAILVESGVHRTQIWKWAIQGPFHQSLVGINPVVSEERIFMNFVNFCLFWPIMQIRKKGGWN